MCTLMAVKSIEYFLYKYVYMDGCEVYCILPLQICVHGWLWSLLYTSFTNMCTWMAVESIVYFIRNGSEVYTCVMDMTKAFDNAKHSILFEKLIHKGIPGIYVRLLPVMCDKQYANVKWIGSVSKRFTIRNGVKQGAVLSVILFCVYIDDLFKILRKKKSGCWVHNDLFGIIGYADGTFLLSPSLDTLQDMITTCENYTSAHSLSFSTDVNPNRCKTKCPVFLKSDRVLRNIKLNGRDLPWVTSTKHLGSMIHNTENGMVRDLMEKRAAYINKNNELMQEFGFAHSDTMIKINNIFNTAFYGSVLWDLFGKEAKRLEKNMERFTTNASITSKDASFLHGTSHRNQTYSL